LPAKKESAWCTRQSLLKQVQELGAGPDMVNGKSKGELMNEASKKMVAQNSILMANNEHIEVGPHAHAHACGCS